jgi:hypothetical protein
MVLYDHGEHAGSDRWVVKHQPSGKALRTGSREKAREWYGQLAQGIDKRGVLPKIGAQDAETRREGDGEKGTSGGVEKKEKSEPPKTLKTPPMPPDQGSPARARMSGGGENALMVRTMEAGTVALAAAIDERFPEERIMAKIEEMLEAEKSFQQDGGIVTVPDWNAREKGVRLLVEYKYGKAYNRKEPVASKGVDMAGFLQKLKVASFRNALKALIVEAEEEDTAATPAQTVIVPNKTPA